MTAVSVASGLPSSLYFLPPIEAVLSCLLTGTGDRPTRDALALLTGVSVIKPWPRAFKLGPFTAYVHPRPPSPSS